MSGRFAPSKGDWVCSDSRYSLDCHFFSSDVEILTLLGAINVINVDVLRSIIKVGIILAKKSAKSLLKRVEAFSVLMTGSVKGGDLFSFCILGSAQ